MKNMQVLLAARPSGRVEESNFRIVWKTALKELGALVHEGKLKYRESIAIGIENAPKAFIGLLNGQNFGKQLVKLI